MDTGKDWSEMSENEYNNAELLGTLMFVQNETQETLAKFIIGQRQAIEGLGKNNKEFAKAYIKEIEKGYKKDEKIESLTASRNAWKKLAEELCKKWVVASSAEMGWECIYCGADAITQEHTFMASGNDGGWDCNHSPDCPIEQLRDLQRSES